MLVSVAPAFATRGPCPPFARSLPRAQIAYGGSSEAAIWGPDAGFAISGGFTRNFLARSAAVRFSGVTSSPGLLVAVCFVFTFLGSNCNGEDSSVCMFMASTGLSVITIGLFEGLHTKSKS